MPKLFFRVPKVARVPQVRHFCFNRSVHRDYFPKSCMNRMKIVNGIIVMKNSPKLFFNYLRYFY